MEQGRLEASNVDSPVSLSSSLPPVHFDLDCSVKLLTTGNKGICESTWDSEKILTGHLRFQNTFDLQNWSL